jgi:hypothetical protein
MFAEVPKPLMLGVAAELDALLAAGFGVLMLVVFLGILIYVAVVVWRRLRGKANRFGYDGVLAYLRAVPKDEAEKRDAVDLVMQGLVLCLLGFAFFPLLLIGIFPLYYGLRKVMLIGLGIGPGIPEVGP